MTERLSYAEETVKSLAAANEAAKKVTDAISMSNAATEAIKRFQNSVRIPENSAFAAHMREQAALNATRPVTIEIVTEDENCKIFDKHICLSNIRELLKTSEIKIGQLEKEAGCQPGYLSRLEKKENTSLPSLDFILTASKMLKVSTDKLLTVPMTELSSTETYIVNLLEKLESDTSQEKLDWYKNSALELNQMESDCGGFLQHPLFLDTRFHDGYYDAEHGPGVVFKSNYFDTNSIIAGDCYSLRLKNNAHLYLMQVSKRKSLEDIAPEKEIWVHKGTTTQFLTGSRDIPCIKDRVEKLFSAVADNMQHPKILNNIKTSLDAFMQDDLGDDSTQTSSYKDDDIPF